MNLLARKIHRPPGVEIEDLRQDLHILVIEEVSKYPIDTPILLEKWLYVRLYGIMRDRYNNLWKRAYASDSEYLLPDMDTFADESTTTDRRYGRSSPPVSTRHEIVSPHEVHELLDTLPEREAFVIRRIYLDNLMYEDVAEELGVSKGTINNLVKSGMFRLRERFEMED